MVTYNEYYKAKRCLLNVIELMDLHLGYGSEKNNPGLLKAKQIIDREIEILEKEFDEFDKTIDKE